MINIVVVIYKDEGDKQFLAPLQIFVLPGVLDSVGCSSRLTLNWSIVMCCEGLFLLVSLARDKIFNLLQKILTQDTHSMCHSSMERSLKIFCFFSSSVIFLSRM